GFNRRFDHFRDGVFQRTVAAALRLRYITVAVAFAGLIISIGLVASGRVGFNFFPSVEPDIAFANVRIAPGGGRTATEAALLEIEAAAYRAEAEFGYLEGGLIVQALAKVGSGIGRDNGLNSSGDEIGSVFLELTPADKRETRTDAFLAAWEAEVQPIAGLETLTLTPAQGGPPGREIDVRLSGGDPGALKRAASSVRQLLMSYPGINAVEDDLPYGKSELILELTEKGRALGFTTESVARQVRSAYAGVIAKRFARGEDEVLVRVRLDEAALAKQSVRDLYLRSPTGNETPLSEVVSFREKSGFAQIRREDGSRRVAVTAEVDETVTTSNIALDSLRRDGIAKIAAEAGVDFRFAGKAEEQAETFKDMGVGALIGVVLMYIVLSWVFGSFARPFAVMAIIPFGFIGATLGHLLMGYNLTILSMIALLGLAGILVNDSIVLISTIDRRIKDGDDLELATREGAVDRLRAVLLTSLTTIGGLAPLMFETSLQARFLIPMAVTIVFGLFFATALVLFLVPSLVMIGQDFRMCWLGVRRFLRRILGPDQGKQAV
ncbi:MAG: efflux RND transporter permease subunit, partial [Alphaproteobacteria bacterium]